MTVRLITVSEVKAHRRCRRLHRILYVRGYRSVKQAPALRFGTLMHAGLEEWWDFLFDAINRLREEGKMAPDHYDPRLLTPLIRGAMLDAALAVIDREPDLYERAKARAMMRAYHERWVGEPLEPLAVELEIDGGGGLPGVEVVNPWTGAPESMFRQGGKMDVVVRWYREDATWGDYVVEHKTASGDVSPGSIYRQRLIGDSQVSIYTDGSRAMGFHTDGVLYDMLVKPPPPHKATPVESRKYTVAKYKQCPECKRKLKFGEVRAAVPHVVQLEEKSNEVGRMVLSVAMCEEDPSGGPRRVCTDPGGALYANMRAEDESPSEYEARLLDLMLGDLDAVLARQDIARLGRELDAARRDIFAEATAILLNENADPGTLMAHAPRNVDACFQYGRTCEFHGVCFAGESLEDPSLFKHVEDVHQELTKP